MQSTSDNDFQKQAIVLLNRQLSGHSWAGYIDKKKLNLMYADARAAKKSHSNRKLVAAADALIDSCARIVRCLCLPEAEAKQTEIRGRVIEMDAESLYAGAEQEHKALRQLAGKLSRQRPSN